jgi:hypothetical protein
MEAGCVATVVTCFAAERAMLFQCCSPASVAAWAASTLRTSRHHAHALHDIPYS